MLILILLLLIALWLLGYSPLELFPLPDPAIFSIGAQTISLYDLLVFGLILWLIDLLPNPFREIAMVILVLFVVSALGFIAIPGLSNIIVIGLIVGLAVYLLRGMR